MRTKIRRTKGRESSHTETKDDSDVGKKNCAEPRNTTTCGKAPRC